MTDVPQSAGARLRGAAREGAPVTADIVEFLLARIAEDEAAARRVAAVGSCETTYRPARALAECDAKRRIVELHEIDPESEQHDCPGEWPNYAGPGDPCPTLLTLAAVYADHPDYREEWRP